MKPPRLLVAKLMIVVAVLAPLLPPVARFIEFRILQAQMGTIIRNLRPTDPRTVSPAAWEDSLDATVTAYAAVFSRPEFVATEAMYRLHDDLDEKLKGKVDLHTLFWIVDRLGRAGPHGERSVEKYRQAISFNIVMPRLPRSPDARESPSP